ncbi:DUF3093 domain-containing protein [Pseudonocardiaceae bacterium YIM PH 21723]|nr:DUF3093 domain-containing protein [Pseudonocardiaceae bacterium YIM PH 21723]
MFGALLLAAEVHLGYAGVRAWLPYAVLLPATAFILFSLGRMKVMVQGGELWVGEAHLPLKFVGEVTVVPKERRRSVLGPNLDPAAYIELRAWVGPVVRVTVTDPGDPTPYWIFSVRSAEELAAVLRREVPKHL